MGLRHRAGIGVTEVSDAVTVIVSEQTGQIAVTHSGRMLHRLDVDRLETILTTFLNPTKDQTEAGRNLIEKKSLIPSRKSNRRAK
jgi:diadenylate cyclase